MAKRLLLDILVKVLGEYIEIDAGNLDLSLAVWSGHIALKNLKLRQHKIFQDLGLSIVYGEIKSLEVTIPWASLLSSPVKVLIDGINLQVGPLNTSQLSKKEIKEQLISAKLEQLQIADQSIDFTGTAAELKGIDTAEKGKKDAKELAASPNAKATYVQQWTAKIIDNIEITLKNVHIRYEDSQTIPGSHFSAGVTLNSFTLCSCDEKWVEKFVERDLNKAATATRKLAKITNFGLYWMTKADVLRNKSFVDWSKHMKMLIYTGTSQPSVLFELIPYILHPENSLLLRLIHDNSDKTAPKFDITVESSNFLLSVDRAQYLQLQSTVEAMSDAEKRRQPLVDRPLERPTSPKTCRIWWKYACKLVIKRKKYMRLVKLSKSVSENSGLVDLRSEAEKMETRELEVWIPLRALVMFRHSCAKEMLAAASERHLRLVRAAIESGQKPPVLKAVPVEPRTWVGWMKGAKKSDKVPGKEIGVGGGSEEEGDVSLESIISSIDFTEESINSSAPQMKLSVATSATLNLSVCGAPVITATMAVTLQAATSAAGQTATVHMRDLLVIDKCSSTPVIKNIIAVKQVRVPSVPSSPSQGPSTPKLKTLDADPSFSVVYESLNGRKIIRVTALPVEMTVNQLCIQRLTGFLLPSPSAPPSVKAVQRSEIRRSVSSDTEDLNFREVMSSKSDQPQAKEEIQRDTQSQREVESKGEGDSEGFELIFEAHAPKIIIPQDSGTDRGYFLLDTGYLSVKGFMGSSGMSLNVCLRDINIGMPRSARDMYACGDQSLYLIKPFNLGLMVQSVDTSSANMTVDVVIEPGLRGELDAAKLARLLQLIPVVSATFSQANCLASVAAADVAVYGSSLPYVRPVPLLGGDRGALSFPDIVSALRAESIGAAGEEVPEPASPYRVGGDLDPLVVTMRVSIRIPEVALDLTYDPLKARHLVLSMRALEMLVLMRSTDMQVTFDLSELSMQDSLRCKAQRDLARTPRDEKRLIHISYTSMSSSLSPLYRQHATEVEVEFSTLALNVDVNTLLNLRPFMEVLLQKPPPPPSTPLLESPPLQLLTAQAQSEVSALKTAAPTSVGEGDAVKGMHVVFTVSNVSLDLLRASTADSEGEVLANTFSLQITSLRADIDMLNLMKADVRLRSLDISDARDISSDYVFKKVVCAVVDMDESLATWRAGVTPGDGLKPAQPTPIQVSDALPDLLHLTYAQTSSDVSEVDITVLNITAFVSMDTVMDLVNVGLANAAATMSLLAAPPVQPMEPGTMRPQPLSSTPAFPLSPVPAVLVETCSIMNVAVKVKNPQLILLEDPTTDESRAVTGSCDIDLHYSTSRRQLASISPLTNAQTVETVESLHVSVRDNKVSVLRSMLARHPQPILEPMGIEFNLKRKALDGVPRSSAISLDMDSVTMRVSTKDVALAQSIMTRRVMFEPAAVSTTESSDLDKVTAEPPLPPSSSISVNMGILSLVGINDFNGQNVPVVRFILDGTNFHSEGKEDATSGEGSLTASAEFYNARLAVWEPILDRWHPSLSLTTWASGSYVDIKSEQTMQLTVSGIMLEKLLQTYSLFFQQDDLVQREAVPDLLISNSLGPGIAFEVHDSATGLRLMSLQDSEVKPVPQRPNQTNLNHITSAADIRFTGSFGSQRCHLQHLPFNVNRPKICNLQYLKNAQNTQTLDLFKGQTEQGQGQGHGVPFEAATVLEPIVEEVFENARYDILTARWRQPFLANDPHEWTDASGTIRRDIQGIELKSDKWEWGGPWGVDMEALVGDQLDRDGWEYGTNFTSFTISNTRRNHSPLDCVRRRRWLRTRVPVKGSVDEQFRPLTVFWDVQVLQSGTRRVEVRSGLQITNAMPFSIMICVGGSVWSKDEEFGPIEENQTLNVPLLHASAAWVKIRLADFPYLKCQQVSCSLQTHDFSSVRDVQCEGEGGEDEGYSPVCMRVLCAQLSKSLAVTIAPVVLITNKLPCDLQYACSSSNKKRDEGRLLPGSSCKLANVNLAFKPEISFSVGNLLWTGPIPMDGLFGTPIKVDVLSPDGSVGAVLVLLLGEGGSGTVELSMHSKGVLCDRTGGIGVSLGYRRNLSGLNQEMVCDSFNPHELGLRTASAYPFVQPPEKQKRQARLRAEEKAHSKARKSNLVSPNDNSTFVQWSAIAGPESGVRSRSVSTAAQGNVGVAEVVSSQAGHDLSGIMIEIHEAEMRTAAKIEQNSQAKGGGEGGMFGEQLEISELTAQSTRTYEVKRMDLGDCVYTDRGLRWTYLPPQLRGQLSIRTPCDDEMARTKRLLEFSVNRPSLVLLLMDMRASKPPKWVEEEGFCKMSDNAIARLAVAGGLYESYYGIYGKYVTQGEVFLRGNWSRESHSMYSVFLVAVPQVMADSYHTSQLALKDPRMTPPLPSPISHQGLQKMYDEATFYSTYDGTDGDTCWTEGGRGVGLFHSEDSVVYVGIKGAAWSDEFKIDMASSPHTGSFESTDWGTFRAYQLSYRMAYMPGLFGATQMLTITPRYCIVNCLEEPILVLQRGAQEVLEIAPYQAEGWHKTLAFLGTTVQLRTASSVWSLGTVDLNEVGRSVIHLPGWGSDPGEVPFVILVEVKMAEPSDNCSVVVVIWQACVETSPALAIRNDSDMHVTVAQADMDPSLPPTGGLFDVCVGPGSCVPFGWADPDLSTDIFVTAGTGMAGAVRVVRLNFLKSGGSAILSDNTGRAGTGGELYLTVVAEGGGRVLRVTRLDAVLASNLPVLSQKSINSEGSEVKDSMKSFGLSFSLASFGLSLVVERPVRREFLSLYIDGLEGRVKTKGPIRSFEFIILDLQVDNYSETAVYPVLLHSLKKENKMDSASHKRLAQKGAQSQSGDSDSSEEVPLLQISLVEETTASSSTLKYVAVRIMPLAIEVESASLQLLVSDLLCDLKYMDADQVLAVSLPQTWVGGFNKRLLSPVDRAALVDVHRSRVSAQATQMYIEKLVIHPMKITLTFVPTPFPRKKKDTLQASAFTMLTSLAAVDRMQLKLKSFEVDDVLESRASLADLVRHKTVQDLQSQLAQIAGSLTVIGSPMGFARKVGSGVKSFFYEPYQGAVLGPQDFVRGLQKGTHHLITNVVSGAMTSTAGIVGSASKGIGFLSGDADYVRKRSLKNQQDRASRGGIMDGLMDGGESVVSGFASGVTGLVTKPYEEACKDGALGFFRGVGLGIMGAALKPVMGVTDGLTSVVSGISNQVDKVTVYVIVRPPRAFERSASDASDLVLVPLNLDASFAQEFVRKRGVTGGYEDTFLCYIPMDVQGESAILSEVYLYWRQPKALWGRTWSNISHVFFALDSVGVMLYGREAEAVVIPCGTEQCAMRLYEALADNAHRMGYPSLVIPLDIMLQESGLSEAALDNLMNRRVCAASLAGMIDDYRFGNANSAPLRKVGGTESAVLKRMEAAVQGGYASWAELDAMMWRMVWDWDCAHVALQAARCCITVIINRSNSPLQIARVQIVHGKNMLILGSASTGYDSDSRVIMPGGSALIFAWAFSPSPVQVGHLKACVSTAAFSATVASIQRESACEARGGFTVGFLEKTVSEWWSKYAILVT